MGNTEVKQLVQPNPLSKDELCNFQKIYRTYGSSLVVDAPLFTSLFDTGRVSFSILDRLFTALDRDITGSVDLAELAVALVAGDRAPVQEKLRFLFSVLEQNGERKLLRKEVMRLLVVAIRQNIARLRGGSGGLWKDRECAGCKKVPKGVVYTCEDCCSGSVLGVPITVCLCSDCFGTWEGIHEEKGSSSKHYSSHRLTAHGVQGSAGQIHHPGVQCDSCGMLPIVGPRYHCRECKDLLELCEGCYKQGAEPLAHSVAHPFDIIDKQQSDEEQVWYFVNELFEAFADIPDSTMSLAEFLEWGQSNELLNNILNGFSIEYVRLSPYEESVQLVEEVYHQDPEIGRIEVSEMSRQNAPGS